MIKELFETTPLTNQEKRIVEYIQQFPECIINHNAKELAELTSVSSPTIIRLTKKLGFDGYLDFQLTYVKEYNLHHQSNIQLSQDSSIDDIIQALPQIYNHVFIETQQLMKKETFIRTINYMLQAKQIDFYANDNNYSEVQSACLKLNTIGIHAQAFNTLSQHYVETFKAQDVLSFVVSHSGKNQTMVDAAYYLRKKRSRVIAITGILDPTLSLICNESLYIDASLHHLPSSIMLYGLSIHYILDILIITLMQKKIKLPY
ncbi:MurR/RpiR family transcriptional regulator [Candidatus Stoquefichus sp. SB1]|uniref:MurR/RpiR family transcriptional regulator n=1 Tax=Candidatus Stoquefichus sp. SB1 TaxID=1658109 RepID=UPI00067F6B48|nr:MurR/RpiR family transcriptional regulator [Candidatus Stoquefichus sp. SB1]